MDKQILEKYKQEMLDMYRRARAVAAPTRGVENSNKGGLIVSVTAIGGLYPVTVFTGDMENMTVTDTSITDESGKSKTFLLDAPDTALSQNAGAEEPVYATYSLLVQADGYLDEYNLNLPVFRGVISLQNVNLTLRASGNGSNTIINDQNEEYNL